MLHPNFPHVGNSEYEHANLANPGNNQTEIEELKKENIR
jgi:hypothetical protein